MYVPRDTTKARRTSENTQQAKFADSPFHALG
jgi:hypothetical protein